MNLKIYKKNLPSISKNILAETEALQNYFEIIVNNHIDNCIKNDDTNTLKTFCVSVYKRFQKQVPKVFSSLNSNSLESHPRSRFHAAQKFHDDNEGFGLDKECEDNFDNEDKDDFSPYHLEQDSHYKKNLGTIQIRALINQFPDKGLPTSQLMRDIYTEIKETWNHYELPLTVYADLKKRKDTIPIEFPVDKQKTIMILSPVLLSSLQYSILKENKLLLDIFFPYRPTLDGYRALYVLV